MSVLNENDMNFDVLFRAEKGYRSIIKVAEALFDLCWYVKLTGSLPWTGEKSLTPILESKILNMSRYIHGYARPQSVTDSIEFINAFIEGRVAKCKNRSTVEDFLKDLIGDSGNVK